jgi:hypothetical protein
MAEVALTILLQVKHPNAAKVRRTLEEWRAEENAPKKTKRKRGK